MENKSLGYGGEPLVAVLFLCIHFV